MTAFEPENQPLAVSRPETIPGVKRRHAVFFLKRAPILLASFIPCFFITLFLLTRTKMTLHHGWLIALFVSAGAGGAVLGWAERFMRKPEGE